MASAPPPPYSPPASPLIESKKESRDAFPLNIVFFELYHPITITENNGRECVKALRDFAYSSVHHDQLAEVLGRILGEAWDRLDAESRPRRRPACQDVVNSLRQSFLYVRIELVSGRGNHLRIPSSNALYLDEQAMCGIPVFGNPSSVTYRDLNSDAGGSTTHPALLYPDVGFALETQLYGVFLLFQSSEHRLSFDLSRDHTFFVEDPLRPGSAYVLPDDFLTGWANNVVEDLSNNCILRKPAIDFATASPAPPPPPGCIRCRLAQAFDPRPSRPAVPAGPPPEGYTRMAVGGMCRWGLVQQLAQEEGRSA
ncbi:hypothetical protein JCM10296v2_002225 [Rhodotorula toruloides]